MGLEQGPTHSRIPWIKRAWNSALGGSGKWWILGKCRGLQGNWVFGEIWWIWGKVRRTCRKPWWNLENGVNLGEKGGFGEKKMDWGKSWWVWKNVVDLGENAMDCGKKPR